MTAAIKLESLNNSSMRMEWDATNKRQVEEAKVLYIRARAANRAIEDLSGKPVLHFSFFVGRLHN